MNQISRFGVRETGTADLLPSDIQDAVAVAALDDFVLHALDCYTYKNFRVSVQGKHVELHALKTQADEAATWSSLRGGSRTFADTIGSPWRIEDVKRLASNLTADSDSFSDFLKCPAGQQVFQSLENICKDHNRILRRDVEELIDLEFVLRTSVGTFRAEQLLDCWSFLFRVALSAHIWRSVFQKSEVPVVPESQLLVLITKSLDLSVENAERLLSQFSLSPRERNQDPFFRPLIKLNSVDRLVAGAFIETGRFARNLFTIAIREGNVDFTAKGLKPLRTVLGEFRGAGYVALINFPVSVSGGTVTDVDVAATKDGYLFIGQTKVLIHPDTPYDDWKILENLGKAAHQLDRSLAHVPLVAAKLGLRAGEYVIVPFLLTNIWDFTGATVGGFKVMDFSYLSLLLRGGEIWKVSPYPVPTREVVKLIAGRYPTGEELSRLLRRSIHEDMFRKPQLGHYTLAVGDWTMTLPIDTSKLPGAKPHTEGTEDEA